MFTIIKDKYIRCFVGLFVFIFLSVATCNSYASVCFLPTGDCGSKDESINTDSGWEEWPETEGCPEGYNWSYCPDGSLCDEKDGCYKITGSKAKDEEPKCTTTCTPKDGHRTCTTDIMGCPIVDKECLDDKYLTLQACKNGNNGANCKLVGDCYEVDTYVAPSCSSKGEGWYDECPTGKTCSQAADGCYQVNEDDTNTIYPYMQVVYNENLIDTSAAIDLGVATSDGARPVIHIREYLGADIYLKFGSSKEYLVEGIADKDYEYEYLSHAYCENGTVKYTNMGADDHPYRKYCQQVTEYDFWDDNNADDLYELNNVSSMNFLNGTQFDLYEKIKIEVPYNEDTGTYWECSEDTCTNPDNGKVYKLIDIEVYQEPKECPDDKICVKFNVTCNGKKCTTADDEINSIYATVYQSQLVYQSHAIDLDKGMATWDDFKPYWQNSKTIKNSEDYFPVSENNLIQYDVSQFGGVLDFIELYMEALSSESNVAMSLDVKWDGHSIHKAEYSPFEDDNTSWNYQPTLYIFLHNNNFKYIVHSYNWDADIYNELEIGSVSKNKNVIEVNVRFDTLDCEYGSEPLHVVVNCDQNGILDCSDEFERESYLEPAVQVCKKMLERGCVVPKLVYYTGGGKGTKTSYSVKQIYSVNGQGEFVDGYNGSYGWHEINGKNINYKYDAMVPTKKYLYTFHNIPVCGDRYDLELTPFRDSYNACNSDECATYSRIYKFYISEENGYVNDVEKHLVENVDQYKDGNGIIRLPDYDENSFYRDIYIAGEAYDKGNYNKIEIPYKYTSLDLTNEYECPLTGSWSESDKTIYYFTTSEVYGTTSGYHGSWYDLCPLVGRDSPIALIRESRGAITYGDKSRFNLNLYLRESKMEIKPVEKK